MRKQIFIAVLACSVFVGLWATAGEAAGPAEELASSKILASFDIPTGGQLITLPVVLGEKTYQFLLDTGSPYNTFDKSLQPWLGKPRESIETLGNDGKKHVLNIYYAPDARLGGISFKTGGAVLCMDLSELRQVSGLDVMGVIGMGFLRRCVLQIDCDAGKLCLMQPGDEKAAPADWGTPIPMRRAAQGSPLILGRLYDKYEAPFIIDTGYSDTGTLTAKLFRRLRKDNLFKSVIEIPIETLAGKSIGLAARVSGFSVGEMKYSGIIFDNTPGGCMLGMGFVRRQKVTLDFPNLKAYFKKGKAFKSPDQNDMSGLHLLKKKEGIVAHSVDKDSPATLAGLKAGDLLYQINGQHVSKLSLWQVRQTLRSKAGQGIEIVFKRGEKFFKTSFVLKKQI